MDLESLSKVSDGLVDKLLKGALEVSRLPCASTIKCIFEEFPPTLLEIDGFVAQTYL